MIGPNPVALIGGRVSVFIKATNNAGTIRIKATTSRLETPVLVMQSVALETNQMLELSSSVR